MAVLFTTAEATPIAKRYAIIPITLDLSIKELILIIKYSRTWDFCRAWLITNKQAIVITAGLENPARLSAGLTRPRISNSPKTSKAVTSIGNNSVTKSTKAIRIIAPRNKISISTVERTRTFTSYDTGS